MSYRLAFATGYAALALSGAVICAAVPDHGRLGAPAEHVNAPHDASSELVVGTCAHCHGDVAKG